MATICQRMMSVTQAQKNRCLEKRQRFFMRDVAFYFAKMASNKSATMLMILIIGLMAGPAVSL